MTGTNLTENEILYFIREIEMNLSNCRKGMINVSIMGDAN